MRLKNTTQMIQKNVGKKVLGIAENLKLEEELEDGKEQYCYQRRVVTVKFKFQIYAERT